MTMTLEPEAPEQSGASSIPADLASLIQDMSTKLDAIQQENAELKAEVQRQKTMTPTYKPMDRSDPHNAEARRQQIESLGVTRKGNAEMDDGQRAFVPVTSGFGFKGIKGNRVPDSMLSSLNKRFSEGDMVRINPEAKREGSDQTWGEILAKHDADGVGVVTRVLDFRKSGMWKYRVRTTRVGGFKGLDGFYDYELLPA
jgi:hypothetical protein